MSKKQTHITLTGSGTAQEVVDRIYDAFKAGFAIEKAGQEIQYAAFLQCIVGAREVLSRAQARRKRK